MINLTVASVLLAKGMVLQVYVCAIDMLNLKYKEIFQIDI